MCGVGGSGRKAVRYALHVIDGRCLAWVVPCLVAGVATGEAKGRRAGEATNSGNGERLAGKGLIGDLTNGGSARRVMTRGAGPGGGRFFVYYSSALTRRLLSLSPARLPPRAAEKLPDTGMEPWLWLDASTGLERAGDSSITATTRSRTVWDARTGGEALDRRRAILLYHR